MKRFLMVVAILSAGLILFAGSRPAGAVPVFARKYQTTCQTCHVIFPKLNAHGEAFRLNGYRMPAGHEKEEPIKETPIALGTEADKRLWPKAVFPTDIPGTVPLAVNVKMASVYAPHDDARNDFEFPQEVNLFSGGTLGDTFSFFGEVTFAERPDSGSDVEIEHAQLHVNSPIGPGHLVNLKIGKFAPDLADGFQEMWLMTGNGIDTLFSYNPIGFRGGTGLSEDGGGIGLPGNVKGIEIYGVAAHRLFYTIGFINGIGPGSTGQTTDGNSRKDYYARIDYKFGGMGLDGSEDNGSAEEMPGMPGMAGMADMPGMSAEAQPSRNWREKSLRVGVLGYTGDGSGIDFAVTDAAGNPFKMQDRRYNRIGIFASWLFQDLNLFGVALHGTDRLRLLDNDTGARIDETTRGYDAWFAQADYVITPALQGSVRYENLRVADPQIDALQFLNLNVSMLVRANVKALIEYRADLRDSRNYNVAGVVRFAF